MVTSAQKVPSSAVMFPAPSSPHTRSQVPTKKSWWSFIINGWNVQVDKISTEGNLTKPIEIENTCTLYPESPPPGVCLTNTRPLGFMGNRSAGQVIAAFGSKSRGSEIPYISINGWVVKYIIVNLCNGIMFSLNKWGNSICIHGEQSSTSGYKWHLKVYLACFHAFYTFLKKKKYVFVYDFYA